MDKEIVRKKIAEAAKGQLDKPYKFGFQIANLDDPSPLAFDCSEFVRWAYHQAGLKIPDGSYNQYEFCVPTDTPKPGDLGFFKETRDVNDASRKVGEIYHVGMFYDNIRMVEARGKPNDKVIFRPMVAWRAFVNFGGFRAHPELM